MTDIAQLRREYTKWCADNSAALDALNNIVKQKIADGYKKWSVAAAFEVLVWEADRLKTFDASGFKMPHNHRAFFAHDWLLANPDFPKFFKLQRQRSAGASGDRYGRTPEDVP
jgi:hypothetical protein